MHNLMPVNQKISECSHCLVAFISLLLVDSSVHGGVSLNLEIAGNNLVPDKDCGA